MENIPIITEISLLHLHAQSLHPLAQANTVPISVTLKLVCLIQSII